MKKTPIPSKSVNVAPPAAVPLLPPLLQAQLSVMSGVGAAFLEGSRHLQQLQLPGAAGAPVSDAWRYWMEVAQVCDRTRVTMLNRLLGHDGLAASLGAALPMWTPASGWIVVPPTLLD